MTRAQHGNLSAATVRPWRSRRTTDRQADGLDFAYLDAGAGPLALCLHGFPDTAWTWRHLLPDAGRRRLPGGGALHARLRPHRRARRRAYQTGALALDACALHEALGGDGDAVLVGHDWGAMATYGAAAPPARALAAGGRPWRCPRRLGLAGGDSSPTTSCRRSWYMFFFQRPAAPTWSWRLDDLEFIDGCGPTGHPGYDAAEDVDAA